MNKFIKTLLLLCTSLSLTSCGFVNYVDVSSSMEQSVVDELNTKKSEYITKLTETYNEDDYENDEKAQIRHCLIEAKAEINECDLIDELEAIFEKHNDIMKAIKTKEDYAKELADKKQDYIEKLKDISDESLYRGKEKETYTFYLDAAEKAINAVESVKEDFDKIFDTYKKIIEAIKTFDDYKNEAIEEIEQYVSLDDYREEEAKAISTLIETVSKEIKKAEDIDDVNSLVRRYKIEVYDYETDETLYKKELLEIIDDCKDTIGSYVDVDNYRDNEVGVINTLISSFAEEVEKIEIKEKVIELLNTYKDLLDAIKTDVQLYEEEKLLLIDNLFLELKKLVDYDSLSQEDKQYYDNFYESLLLVTTKERVESDINDEKVKYYKKRVLDGDGTALVPYQLSLIDSLSYYLDKSLYRDEQIQEINTIITNSYVALLGCANYEDTMTIFNGVKNDLDDVLTNEEAWEKEDLDFFTTLNTLYGDDVLIPSGSLIEADDYFELAKIIDYYAFYQLDSESFVRDTFRVKLNWSSEKIPTLLKAMRNEYCELAKYAVDTEAWYENDYLVIKLIPYDFGSLHHEGSYDFNLHDCNVVYSDGSDTSGRTSRGPLFNDFAYLSYSHSVKVWNTQQLWYALEHNYVPICKEGSIAEYVFNHAKEVLIDIIQEGMSEEEKMFTIYTWIAKNIAYSSVDFNALWYMASYPEGAFVDGFVKCRGFAKLYLIMLKIEGFDAHLTYSYASAHETILININGLVYASDTTFATHGANYLAYKYLLTDTKIENVLYKDYEYASSCSDIYKRLYRNGICNYVETIEEYEQLLNDYLSTSTINESLNILYSDDNAIDLSLIPENVTVNFIQEFFGDYSVDEIVLVREL